MIVVMEEGGDGSEIKLVHPPDDFSASVIDSGVAVGTYQFWVGVGWVSFFCMVLVRLCIFYGGIDICSNDEDVCFGDFVHEACELCDIDWVFICGVITLGVVTSDQRDSAESRKGLHCKIIFGPNFDSNFNHPHSFSN